MLDSLRNLIADYYRPITLCILLAITVLSLIPLPELPSVSGSDKTHHILAYAALMFPIALRRPAHWLWLGLLFLIWSAGIELIQPFVNRYGELTDLLANLIGLLVGALLAKAVNSIDKWK